MSIYAAPAILALLVKLFLAGWAARKPDVRSVWLGFVLVFAIHNMVEVLVFAVAASGSAQEWVVRSYYVCVNAVLFYSLLYASDGFRGPVLKAVLILVGAIATVLSVITLTTNLVVTGTQLTTYSIAAVRGEYYSHFQWFTMLTAAAVLVVVIIKYVRAAEVEAKVRALYDVFALIPLSIATVIVTAMMYAGYNATALSFIPIASTCFLIITYLGSGSKRLSRDPRHLLPGSPEHEIYREFNKIRVDYAIGEANHHDVVRAMERALVGYKLKINQGNATHTAQSMGIPRSTLYEKASRLGIDLKQHK